MKIAAFWLFLALTCFSLAQTYPAKPSKTWVADEARLIDAADKERIRHDSATLMHTLGCPIVVATIPSLRARHAAKLTIEQYGRKLFDHWGIGSQNHNLGILLLVSKGDRKVRIEMGADWRNRFDGRANEIMKSDILPSFKKRSFSQGIRKGADALLQMAQQKPSKPTPETTSETDSVLTDDSGPTLATFGLLVLLCPFGFLLFVVFIVAGSSARRNSGGAQGRRGQASTYDPVQDLNNPLYHPKPPTYDPGTSSSSGGGFDAGSGGGGSSGGGGFDGGSGGGGGSTGSY